MKSRLYLYLSPLIFIACLNRLDGTVLYPSPGMIGKSLLATVLILYISLLS